MGEQSLHLASASVCCDYILNIGVGYVDTIFVTQSDVWTNNKFLKFDEGNIYYNFNQENFMINTNAKYTIKSKHSDKVLDVCQDVNQKGMLIIYDNYKQPNQLFRFVEMGAYYQIVSLKSNKMLTVCADNNSNGIPIFEEIIPGLEGQKFTLKPAGKKNQFFIQTFCGKVLDCFQQKKANGTKVIQYDHTGGNNQKWILEEN